MIRPRGFTLVELLVVMAILALLTGILLPVFAKVRASALSARCVSNMRNLQMAHWMYLQANDGWFIDVGLDHGGGHGDEEVTWVNTLQEYYDSPLLLRSPADNSPHWPADQGGMGLPIEGTTDTFRRTSYGVNNFLSRSVPADPVKVYDRLHTVKNHVQTVHFVIMALEGEYAGGRPPARRELVRSRQSRGLTCAGVQPGGHRIARRQAPVGRRRDELRLPRRARGDGEVRRGVRDPGDESIRSGGRPPLRGPQGHAPVGRAIRFQFFITNKKGLHPCFA